MEYTFLEFFAIWANLNKWKIPEVHIRLLDFLEDDDWSNDTKIVLCFRGIGKSTLIDLWVAYKLSKEPHLRFLILSADFETAKKGTQDILSILKRHPLCGHLINDQLETKQNRFFVNGSTDRRNPSVVAFGISSNVTGGRADYIIYDDVEVKRNCGTDIKRHDLRRRIAESAHLLVPETSRRLFIGTYHDYQSIYDEEIANGAALLRIPILKDGTEKGDFPNISGQPNWPERFPIEVVYQKQKICTGKAEFYSQYMLIPSSVEDGLLDPNLIKRYTDEIEFYYANKHHSAKIGETQVMSVTAWWDVSLSGARRDDSVLAIVYTDSVGNIYLHRILQLEGDADEQCRQVRRYALQFHLPLIKVETNGIGNFLPQILLKHLSGTGIGVDGVFTSQRKNDKIVEAFETPLYAGILHAHISVIEGKFYTQFRDFNYQNHQNKDDYIDAPASAIKEEPIRIAAFSATGDTLVHQWTAGGTVDVERDYFQI